MTTKSIFIILLIFYLLVNLSLVSSYEADIIIQNPSDSSNYIALTADAGGAILPGVTGLGIAVRTAKGADKVLDVVKYLDKTEILKKGDWIIKNEKSK